MKYFTLIYGIVVFLLATVLLIMVPQRVPHMNAGQWTMLLMICILGYFSAGLCFWVYTQTRKDPVMEDYARLGH